MLARGHWLTLLARRQVHQTAVIVKERWHAFPPSPGVTCRASSSRAERDASEPPKRKRGRPKRQPAHADTPVVTLGSPSGNGPAASASCSSDADQASGVRQRGRSGSSIQASTVKPQSPSVQEEVQEQEGRDALPLSEAVPVPTQGQLQFPGAVFKLRPYQLDAISTVIKEWKEGVNAQMVMLPTGCGKTVVFAALARYLAQHYTPPADVPAAATGSDDTPDSTPTRSTAAGRSAPQLGGGPVVAAATAGDDSVSNPVADPEAGDAVSTDPLPISSRFQGLRGAVDLDEPQQLSTSITSSTTESTASSQLSAIGAFQRSSESTASKASRAAADAPTATSSSEDVEGGGRSGKGRKAAEVKQEVEAPPGAMRVLVLAHRHELLRQAEEKFKLMWGDEDLTVSWVKGGRKEYGGQVVVASVATAVNCIPALKECNFSLVIVDEAHHTVAATYKSVLQGLGLIEELTPKQGNTPVQSEQQNSTTASSSSSSDDDVDSESSVDDSSTPGVKEHVPLVRVLPNPHQLLLGFTATPYRLKTSESRHLYDIFSTTYACNISDMIRQGYLAQISSQKILTQTDLKGAVVGKGDFIASKLSPLVNSRTRNKLVLAAYLEHCTEPADGAVLSAEEQWQQQEAARQHLELMSMRASVVSTALQAKIRRDEAKQQQRLQEGQELKRRRGQSSADDDDEAEEDEEEEELPLVYPLPPDTPPAALTGGLSLNGRTSVRKAIVFAVDIKHAEAMNAVFNAAGVRSSAVHSLMPYDVMKGELTRFRSGKLDVLFNVEVLTEGFDEPAIDAILMARPTRSVGLYTQMLGRGLRIMPGKQNCLVLDFTDKYHQAGKVVDLRVLFLEPEIPAGAPNAEPEGKGPSRIEAGAEGGEVDILQRGLDPRDLAWRNLGPHCVTSIFSGGNVWLVACGGMGPEQQAMLGLQGAQQRQQAEEVGAGGDGGDGSDAEEEEEDSLQDRYVVLHQRDGNDPNPFNWLVAFKPGGHTWRGLSKEDAFGAALDYIDQYVQKEQVRVVRAAYGSRQQGRPSKLYYPHLNSFKKDAPWRNQPASDKQLQKLKDLQVDVSRRLTKGEASDLISTHHCALAIHQQQQLFKGGAALPVPLLKAYVAQEMEKA